jgi:hypothetical protein
MINPMTRIRLIQIAFDLARAGDKPHKEKNEALLKAISEILHIAQDGGDELPF